MFGWAKHVEQSTISRHPQPSAPLQNLRESSEIIIIIKIGPLILHAACRALFAPPVKRIYTHLAPRRTFSLMRWSLRVVTGLTADTEPCILIRFEQPPASYILNTGEGTNRAFIQRLCSIAQTKAIFLSDLSPQCVGGFPGAGLLLPNLFWAHFVSGLVMSLFDMDRRGLTVCGPPGLAHYVASTRYYTKR